MRSDVIAMLATLALVGCGAPSTPDFVEKAAMSDMYEVQAGTRRRERSIRCRETVWSANGRCSFEDHRGAYEHRENKKYQGGTTPKLDAKHQKLIDDLNSASAQDFDKTYAEQQVDAHKEAVDLFKKYASKGDDPDVKQFAEKTLPPSSIIWRKRKSCPSGRRQLEEEIALASQAATRVEERSVESSASAVEWAAIFGGGLAAFGVTNILLTLGPGLGLRPSRRGHS